MFISGQFKNAGIIALLALFVCSLIFESGTTRPRVCGTDDALFMLPHSQSSRKYLLSVGINDYRHSPLSGCVNDAISMMALLTGHFGFNAAE